ncbi:MAG: DUF1579 family protein [Phycisphaerales bacterium]|nr:DUF1579 domain-containing protein [Phycisphaerae bacterium]NNF42426.1 DUF1579 family protein [Phycisphaerales bacterium]NNM26930.1 DUF1579 family protein [Phycisphaerales bacterium]
MRKQTVLGLAALVGLGFVAGRMDIFATTAAVAVQDAPPAEMDPQMQAWMDAGTPTKHHKYLNVMNGTWDAKFTMWMEPGAPPMVSIGTIKRHWALDGRYLAEEVEAQTDFGTFHGLGYLGYNNVDGQYEFIWMDSMSTAIMSETGSYNPETKVMHTRGSMRDPASGHIIASRGMLDMSDPDRHVYTGYMTGADGKEYKSFEGISERR